MTPHYGPPAFAKVVLMVMFAPVLPITVNKSLTVKSANNMCTCPYLGESFNTLKWLDT